MQGTAIILHPDGRKEQREYTAPITLDEMQAAVGGCIEMVPTFDGYPGVDGHVLVFANEDGLAQGLPYNHEATMAWRLCKRYGFAYNTDGKPPQLVGPVLVCYGDAAWMREV